MIQDLEENHSTVQTRSLAQTNKTTQPNISYRQDLLKLADSDDLINIADFMHLQKEKFLKLKETGLKMLHNAHPMRAWLYERKFTKTFEDSPNCPTCQEPQTQEHALNTCEKNTNSTSTIATTLWKLKIMNRCISFRIGENTGTNTVNIDIYFKEIVRKYGITEEHRNLLKQTRNSIIKSI